MFSIILKLNSTFGTIGKTTTNKLIETVDGKNSSFRISLKNLGPVYMEGGCPG